MARQIVKRTFYLMAALLSGLALFALYACADGSEEPVTFRAQLPNHPETLDPAQAVSVYSLGVVDRLFDGLMRLDRTSHEPVPHLAESVQVSPDGLSYEFRLSPAARFHNGRQVRASDFVISWQRILDSETDSPSAWLLEPITGAREYHEGLAAEVAGLEAVDPDLLRVRLEQPFAPFLHHLATAATSVVPHEEVAALGQAFTSAPIGSGPYRLVENLRGLRLVLEAVETAIGGRPAAERLIFEVVPRWDDALKMFEAGDLDLLTQLDAVAIPELRARHSAHLHTLSGFGWNGFCFQAGRAPFDDVRVRRAFALAVDRDALVETLGPGRFEASASLLPAAVLGRGSEGPVRGHDLERARELLAEAGYGPGASAERDFPPVVFTGAPHLSSRAVTLFATEALLELDLPVSYRLIEFSTLLEGHAEGVWDLHHQAWVGDYPHPEAYLRPLFHSRGSANYFGYENPEVDRLLDEARAELVPERRRRLYDRAERRVREDAPCVVLAHEREAVLLSSRWEGIPLGYVAESLEVEKARRVGP